MPHKMHFPSPWWYRLPRLLTAKSLGYTCIAGHVSGKAWPRSLVHEFGQVNVMYVNMNIKILGDL